LLCGECGCVIPAWDQVWTWAAGDATEQVCEDCFSSLLWELSAREAAERMGLPIKTPEEFRKL
jgi:hypothetical protein